MTEREENTVEDWRDLHNVIEGYIRRRAARHIKAHVAPPASGQEPAK